MVLYEIYMTSQNFFKIFCSTNIIVKFRRHRDEKVNIAALVMVATSHRTKKAHRSDAKTLLQFWQMLLQYLYVFLRSFHSNSSFRLQI